MRGLDKKRRVKKALGVSWITVWLIMATMAFASVVGYAAYTRVVKAKRVVSTKEGVGILFSSNYMSVGSSKTIEYDDYSLYTGSMNPIYTVNVCNFAQGDRSTWYLTSDIGYRLTATIYLNETYSEEEIAAHPEYEGQYKTPSASDLSGKLFGIRKGHTGNFTYFSGNQLTVTLPTPSASYTLSKSSISMDEFDLVFDKSELLNNTPGFWIQLTATPQDEVGGEVVQISGLIGVCKRALSEAKWTGYINDVSYATTDYDAYNYVISGNGKGTFYFAWDDDMVKPNAFTLLNYKNGETPLVVSNVSDFADYVQYGASAPTTGTWKCVAIIVDSKKLARYEIQLLKTQGYGYLSNTASYVDYKFVPSNN